MTDRLEAFKGRLALVTGAGDGIGRMLARTFAAHGMRVAVLDIREDAARDVAAEIGGGAIALVADVSERTSVVAVADRLKAAGESLALLWINAGVGAGSSLLDGSPRAVEWVYGVNVLGAIWTAQAFVPLMTDTNLPRHVGITASSAAIVSPAAPLTLYAASKHATLGVAEALREELMPRGIGATILCPGLLNTNIWDAARARPQRFGGERRADAAVAGRWHSAQSPDVMVDAIVARVDAGGGYVVAYTQHDTPLAFAERTGAIRAGFVDLCADEH
jgi:NAD(P)-dependent dehydrogenase (short-subunit alcohol dehydrogenase family)